jgi:hypothetical protein
MDEYFNSSFVESLPDNAWILTVPPLPEGPVLRHGAAVETFASHFYEGAWSGVLDRAPTADVAQFGTGGIFEQEGVEIRTSLYKTHGVFVTDGPVVCVSNSLPLTLAVTRGQLTSTDWYCWRHHAAVSLGWRGISLGLNCIPTTRGDIRFFYNARVRIAKGRVSACELYGPRMADGMCFRDYEGLLTKSSTLAVANAAAASRRRPFLGCVATLSSGYDSTAAAIIGRSAGCDQAVTIDAGDGDSGAFIGRALGLQTAVVDEAEAFDELAIATVFAMPGNTVHTPWLALRPFVRNRVVFTGWFGDTAWSLKESCAFRSEFAARIGMAGLPEARLWMGCAFLPIATVGGGDQHKVVALSRCGEMKRYRTMDDYDRPIPRRMAVDAGVDGLLARRKLASSIARPLLPAPVVEAVDSIARTLRLEQAPEWMVLARQQYELAGWKWGSILFQTPVQLLAMESIYRWAISRLTLEYTERLARPASGR